MGSPKPLYWFMVQDFSLPIWLQILYKCAGVLLPHPAFIHFVLVKSEELKIGPDCISFFQQACSPREHFHDSCPMISDESPCRSAAAAAALTKQLALVAPNRNRGRRAGERLPAAFYFRRQTRPHSMNEKSLPHSLTCRSQKFNFVDGVGGGRSCSQHLSRRA